MKKIVAIIIVSGLISGSFVKAQTSVLNDFIEKELCVKNIESLIYAANERFNQCYSLKTKQKECLPCFQNYFSSLDSLREIIVLYQGWKDKVTSLDQDGKLTAVSGGFSGALTRQEARYLQILVETVQYSIKKAIKMIAAEEVADAEVLSVFSDRNELIDYWNNHVVR